MKKAIKALVFASVASTAMAGAIYELELKIQSDYRLAISAENEQRLINDTTTETHTLTKRNIVTDEITTEAPVSFTFNEDNYVTLDINGELSDESAATFSTSYENDFMAEEDERREAEFAEMNRYRRKLAKATYYNLTRPSKIADLRTEFANEYVSVSDEGEISLNVSKEIKADVDTYLIGSTMKKITISAAEMQKINEAKLKAESSMIAKRIVESHSDVEAYIIKSVDSSNLVCEKIKQEDAYNCKTTSLVRMVLQAE